MTCVYIGLGANLGDAKDTVQHALLELEALPNTTVTAISSFYHTAPVDAGGPDYINAVAQISTPLAPVQLLHLLQEIENNHGRVRPYANAPRTLDLDILLYGNETINNDLLTIPHPRMHRRAFVLQPLAELNPTLALPQGSILDLIAQCSDQFIRRLPHNGRTT